MFGNWKYVNEKIILIITSIILAVIYYINVRGVSTLLATGDEFGYISNAAYLIGIEWSEGISIISAYAFGYSLFLIPIMKFIEYGDGVVNAAQVLNILLACGSFVLNYYILKMIHYKNEDEKIKWNVLSCCVISAFSLGITLYISQIWGEILIVFIFSLIVYLFIKLYSEPRMSLTIYIGIAAGFTYMVHMRNLIIIISTTMAILCLYFIKKIQKKDVFYYLVFLIVLIVGATIGNANLKDELYNNAIFNTYSSVIGNYQNINSSNTLAIIVVILGQIYALGLSTLGMGHVFIVCTCYQLIQSWRKKCMDLHTFIYGYIFVSLLGMVALTIYLFASGTYLRADKIFYTRYSTCIILLCFMFGFFQFADIIKKNKKMALRIGGFSMLYSIISALLIQISTPNIQELEYYRMTAPSTLSLFEKCGYQYNWLIFAFVPLLTWCIIYIIFTSKNRVIQSIIILLIVVALVKNDQVAISNTINKTNLFEDGFEHIKNNNDDNTNYYFVTELSSVPDAELGSVMNEITYNLYDIQAFLLGKNLEVVDLSDLNYTIGDYLFTDIDFTEVVVNDSMLGTYVLEKIQDIDYHYNIYHISVPEKSLYKFDVGECIGTDSDLGKLGNYIYEGVWIDDKETYAWTIGNKAKGLFYLDDIDEDNLIVEIGIDMVMNDSQRLICTVGGGDVYENTITESGTLQFEIDNSLIKEGFLELEIEFPDCVSPKELGQSEDVNEYAVMIKTFGMYKVNE